MLYMSMMYHTIYGQVNRFFRFVLMFERIR